MDQEKLQYLSRETAELSQEFLSQLLEESERSAVVLGAARLDVALANALKCLMCCHPNGQDNLFDSERPLGSLSAKIALAYRLGVIDQDVEHALQVIRKIRNEFAHSITDESLSLQRHRDRIRAATSRASKSGMWLEVAPAFENLKMDGPLRDFAMLLTVTIALLEAFSRVQVRVEVIPVVRFEPAAK